MAFKSRFLGAPLWHQRKRRSGAWVCGLAEMAVKRVEALVILDDAMLIANNKTGQCSSLPRVCEPKPFGRKRPKTHESRRIFGLAPGGYHRGFADRVFANWSFADREFADWPRLYNGLRTGEVRRNGRSHQGQRCSPNDHEFQRRSLLLPNLPQVDSQLTERSLRGN
jgi:hypothetical protein